MGSLFLLCKRLRSVLTFMCFIPVISGGGSSTAAAGEIPHCTHFLGSVALTDQANETWWGQYKFAPPSRLLSKIIEASGCFRVVTAGQNPDYILIGNASQHVFASGDEKSAVYVSIGAAKADVSLSLNQNPSTGKSVKTFGHAENSDLSYGRGGGIAFLDATDPGCPVMHPV